MIPRLHPDRINNFCDAVFAIAMTLLILEIKVPTHEQMEKLGFIGSLRNLIPSFIGFFISFIVTALYWRAHLTIARFAKGYDNRQLWLTVWLLLFIVLLPFSTALYSEYFNHNYTFIFYCSNLVMIGLFHYLLTINIVNKEKHHEELTPNLKNWLKWRASIAPIIWALSIGWVFIEPYSARFLFLSIFVIQIFIDRKHKTN